MAMESKKINNQQYNITKKQYTKENISLNSEWNELISCDPSDITENVTLSMSSVDPDDIPDDITLSLSSFEKIESDDSLNESFSRNNLTESDLSPEIELKDEKIVADLQPNVGEKRPI